MRLVKAKYEIDPHSLSYENAVHIVSEACASCYELDTSAWDFKKRESYIEAKLKPTDRFKKHESVIEHAGFTVTFTMSRSIGNEIVRHRIASYTQSSSRYCRFDNDRFDGHVPFIIPEEFGDDIPEGLYHHDCIRGKKVPFTYYVNSILHEVDGIVIPKYFFTDKQGDIVTTIEEPQQALWFNGCYHAEQTYLYRLHFNGKAELARENLPLSLKSILVVTANMREWRRIFDLRAMDASGPAHPHMKYLMKPLFMDVIKAYPAFFNDLAEIYDLKV